MLESPGDADRATAGVADVLARTEEVVGRKKTRGLSVGFYSERIAQCERSNACRRAGFWPCPLLANMRLRWVRLRRLATGGSRCGMRWILSKK
jgi:hypothetical protein